MGAEDVDEVEDVDEAEDVDEVEALEEASIGISKDEARRSAKLWFAVLGSPLAWAGHLVANYSLEEWFACSDSATTQGEILGLSVPTMAVLINTAMLVIAALSGLVGVRCWKALRAEAGEREGDERFDRARWMAFAAMVEAALFVLIILLGYLPALTLGTCETSP